MSNLHNLQGVVKEMTSKSHHVIQTKHENKQANNGDKYTCFCEESFIDRSFSVLEFLGGALCAPPPHHPLMNTQVKKTHCE